MLTSLISISVYVLNLERALEFYVDKLGFQVHTDILIGTGSRWASVCIPGQCDKQLMLIPVEEGAIFSGEQVYNMQELIRKEIFSYGVFYCSNLQETYELLQSKGVRFLMKPGQGFLGQYEASFTDDSGNWFRLTQDPDAV
jgi:catechol 2,3-dioxygenase-like lactoylglutathione lyase family enzyme